ncbi:MAG: MoaD/ThiS family protein [Chthoniobacterales bacterium]|nr:MoaD/ThiS family protein [Chthoniobacterales bacterium]
MKIRVQFFSHLKEIARTAELEIDLPDGATVSDLLTLLYTQRPGLREWDGSILIGAGVEFVARDHVLLPNEEISLMPPVQGG